MMKNKKAQNMTKPYTVILVLVIISILSISMNEFGADIAASPNNNLDEQSLDVIYNRSGFVPGTNKSEAGDADDLFFSSDTNTSGSAKDFTLEFQFFREQASNVRVIIQDVWGAPQFFVSGLGLDASDWRTTLFIYNTIVWIILFYVIYRLLRGSV